VYQDRIDDHLTELAHHYRRSTNTPKAVKYLHLAGRQAAERSAHSEALAYFERGLQLLNSLPPGSERVRLELLMQIGSGFSLRATKGFTAPEVERALVRARELCSDVTNSGQLFDVLVGLHTFYMFGPRHGLETSRELAAQLLTLAQRFEQPSKLAMAHLAMGETTTYLGEFHSARSHLERAIELGSRHHGVEQNALGYLGSALWSLGYPDQGVERIRKALSVAAESLKKNLTANVFAYACTLFVQKRLWQATRQHAEAGIALANQHGFLFHIHLSTLFRGRALIEEGHTDQGIIEMRRGISGLDALGAARPWLICYLAEGCLKVAQVREGLRVLSRAASQTEETGERWAWADIHRLRGELLLADNPSETKEAEHCFRTAIEVARQQNAKSFELRATASLARLLDREGHRDAARGMLAEIYGWFTEGFDYADLEDTRALLDEMR
jgi:tetratricopeptide (TPR) repeat protein